MYGLSLKNSFGALTIGAVLKDKNRRISEEQITLTHEDLVHKALKVIVASSHEKALNYCVNYAKAGLQITGHELHVQILYVLNNMAQWQGDTAKQVRRTLKNYIKNSR